MKKKTKVSKRIQKELKEFDKGVRQAQKEIERARAGLIPESDWDRKEEKQAEEKTAKAIKKQPKKRILSVTIKRMVDDSPDTSWLGEYSNTPANEFAIDRAHAEDCASVRPDVQQAKKTLEHVQQTIGDLHNDVLAQYNGTLANEKLDAEKDALDAAYDAVSELIDSIDECDCGFSGHWNNREYRYFNPSFNYVKKAGTPLDLTAEEVREYTRQDYERMERLNRGDWCFIGIVAHAEIGLSRPGNTYLIELVHSGGLYGLESDAGEYLESVEQDQLADLKQVLKDLGFSSRAISQAFKNVERKDS
jgi:hypothetical protein